MIVPLSLLADITSSNTRRFLMITSRGLSIKCFPQKDDRNRRVFRDAKLSTMIFVSEKRPPTRNLDTVTIEIYPGKSLTDHQKKARIRPADAALLDPKHIPLPLVDEPDWELCSRIHRHPKVVRLGEMNDFSIRRGEINQKVLEDFISLESGGGLDY